MRSLLLLPLVVALGCGGPATTPLEAEPMIVGCGSCQFKQQDYPGCYWAGRFPDGSRLAGEVDGRVLPLIGDVLPPDEESHGPEGMCLVQRQALVTGELERDRVVVRAIELQPVTDAPAPGAHGHAH